MRKHDHERAANDVSPNQATVELPNDYIVPARFSRGETSRELVLALLREAQAES